LIKNSEAKTSSSITLNFTLNGTDGYVFAGLVSSTSNTSNASALKDYHLK